MPAPGWTERLEPGHIAVPAALLWLLVGMLWRPIGDYGVETDFLGDFLPHGRLWLSGQPDVLTGYRGPGYYLLVGVLDRLGGAFALAKAVSALCLGGGCGCWAGSSGISGTAPPPGAP
jgi:hypothetical protein